jgi:CRP-like cAMP-binding protein
MAPPTTRVQPGSNRILDLLPVGERARMFAALEETQLVSGQILAFPGEAYTHVLFPSSGVVSVLVPMGEEPAVEAGVIGFEGMVGVPLALGIDRGPHEVIVQVPDGGWRMSAGHFRGVLPECPVLRDLLQRYVLTFLNQTARASACNRRHEVNQRLARWLLMVHDRVLGTSSR